eukprot:6207257-Pleurochrysis_carterae.AAC.1
MTNLVADCHRGRQLPLARTQGRAVQQQGRRAEPPAARGRVLKLWAHSPSVYSPCTVPWRSLNG